MTTSARRARWILPALVIALACRQQSPPPPPLPPPAAEARPETWFELALAGSGLDFHHRSGAGGEFYYPESMVGGVGLCDLDGDGALDAYLVQSGSLGDGAGGEELPNRLYLGRGDGTFEDATEVSGTGDTGYGMGVACGDYDADGDVDLYVTNVGPNVLYQGRGDGTFDDVTASAGVGHPGWGASSLFFDADGDGDLDLLVVNYLEWSPATEQVCKTTGGPRDYCGPANYRAPARDVLYLNRGDGTFEDLTEVAGLDRAFGNGLGATTGDFNGDGRPDLYVANDQTPNQLWLNRDGTFEEAAILAGTAVNRGGMAEAGMGVAAVDVDADGDLDLFLSHLAGETNTLYRNLAERGRAAVASEGRERSIFQDVSPSSGLAAPSLSATGFGLGFADFDHDGRLDLYVAGGRVSRALPVHDPGDPYAEPDLLFRGRGGGSFSVVAQADPPVATGRGAAFGDLDGDGDVDILVANRDAPPLLLRNVAARGHWIMLRILDHHGGDALGATVRLTTGDRVQWRTVQTGYSYLASSDPRVHFGLGTAERVDSVVAHWPGGEQESFGPFAADQIVELRRGASRSVLYSEDL